MPITAKSWSHGQATLFTGYAWRADGVSESCVLVSDELQHTKLTDYLIRFLKDKYPAIKKINVFFRMVLAHNSSSGSCFLICTCRRRNIMSTRHGISLQLHIVKGWLVNGLGSTVTRSVWRHVQSGLAYVTTPTSFYEAARECNPNINKAFISSASICENQTMFEKNWEVTKPVPYTHKLHYVQPSGEYHVLAGSQRKAIELKTAQVSDDDEENSDEASVGLTNTAPVSLLSEVTISDWVIVTYDGVQYLGEAVAVDCSMKEIKVNVMHRSVVFWKWPRKMDSILYNWDNLRRSVLPKLQVHEDSSVLKNISQPYNATVGLYPTVRTV